MNFKKWLLVAAPVVTTAALPLVAISCNKSASGKTLAQKAVDLAVKAKNIKDVSEATGIFKEIADIRKQAQELSYSEKMEYVKEYNRLAKENGLPTVD
ncbi:hypothetical protein ACX1NB_01425 [Mycoplasma sp. HF14]